MGQYKQTMVKKWENQIFKRKEKITVMFSAALVTLMIKFIEFNSNKKDYHQKQSPQLLFKTGHTTDRN